MTAKQRNRQAYRKRKGEKMQKTLEEILSEEQFIVDGVDVSGCRNGSWNIFGNENDGYQDDFLCKKYGGLECHYLSGCTYKNKSRKASKIIKSWIASHSLAMTVKK